MKSITCCILILLSFSSRAQYWQQQVDHDISVTLNDSTKTLDAFETIHYKNNSPDTLKFIWFHIWPNAYKNDRTAYSDAALETTGTDFYFSSESERGYINRLNFRVNNVPATWEDHPQWIDVIKLTLPNPLAPGAKIDITTPFHVKLPRNFSRGGYAGYDFAITQWFPKPAVYDALGWHPMPYLDLGEFYADFGKYDVKITVPGDYKIAATGELMTEGEADWLLSAKPVNGTSPSKARAKTLHYLAENVHDFAWFASRNYVVERNYDTIAGNHIVTVESYYHPSEATSWQNSSLLAKRAVDFYSSQLGAYPHPAFRVISGPTGVGGGMEYPMATLISPVGSQKVLDQIIAHELGHNWFQGILATNERDNPWMDEGMNTFYEQRYMNQFYGAGSQEERLIWLNAASRHTDQPLTLTSEGYNAMNYGGVVYQKTADWMRLMESQIGKEAFDRMMKEYYASWKFKHPQPEDFYQSLKTHAPEKADSFITLANSTGLLPARPDKAFQVVSIFKPSTLKSWLSYGARNSLVIMPSAGVNHYDGVSLGLLLSNYQIPANRFSFLLTPMIGLKSGKLTGITRNTLSFTSSGLIRKLDLGFNASTYSINKLTDGYGADKYASVLKLVPRIQLTFRNRNPHSMGRAWLQVRSFNIKEDRYLFGIDSIVSPTEIKYLTTIGTTDLNYKIQELKLAYENTRNLYPWKTDLTTQINRNFVRLAWTGEAFFNYREGGLRLRGFAGKFISRNSSYDAGLSAERFALQLSAPNGYEDYTYENFFFERNAFEGLNSRQLMMRDGAFKLRTDLLANKVGRTNNWLAAINLNSTIPRKLNPLSILPIKIPLNVFADVGTYAEAWDRKNEQERFLFDAGLSVPIMDGAFEFFFPLVSSRVFSDYYKTTVGEKRFLKSIGFSVNLHTPQIRKLTRELEF